MNQPPRTILYVHPSDELYGSDRCLLDIIGGLPEDCRAIVVLPLDLEYAGALSRELEAVGAIIERVDMLVLRRALLQPRRMVELVRRYAVGTRSISRLIRHYDADLVHSNTVAVVCGASAAALTSTPHLWHVHEHIGDESRPYASLIRLMLSCFPGRIVANSRSVARALIGASQDRLRRTRVIENSVDPKIRPARRPKPTTERPVIGVVGRLAPRKGTAEAIEAAEMLARDGMLFEMRFVGATPPGQETLMSAYRNQVERLGVGDRVNFAGQVADIRPQLAEFDILLLPSQRPEPFGLVVIEGMAAGLPVVATLNGGGSDEILDHGVTGIYCGRDPASMASALAKLLESPDRWREIGEVAATVAARRYSRARYQRDFQSTYERLTGASG
jgi:glycosyltransferase involved in cell wall biosynthesis